MEAKVYNKSGQEVSSVKLPEAVFGAAWNADLVHQVVTSMLDNARTPVAHTKTRGEVRGGGKKPWRQKGTGRARHGSTRSPIWVGGGVAHGPRNDRDYSRKINRKVRAKALYAVLSKKLKDQEVVFIDELNFTEPKTKEAINVMRALAKIKGLEGLARKKVNAAFITLPEKNVATAKSFNNIGKVELDEVRNLNPVDLLQYKYLVVTSPEVSIERLAQRLTAKPSTSPMLESIKPDGSEKSTHTRRQEREALTQPSVAGLKVLGKAK